MNTHIQQILVDDHVRTLYEEAAAARLAVESRQSSKARPSGLIRPTGWRPEFVRRLVARLAGA